MRNLICVLAMAFVISLPVTAFAFGDYTDRSHHNNYGDTYEGDTINKAKVKVDNRNTNVNTNINSNRQDQDQEQSQDQLQLQGQIQGQGQKQEANNEGNHQTLNQKFEDKRDLINPFYTPQESANLADHGDVSTAKTKGSIWSQLDGINKAMAKHASKGASDIDLEYALLFENDFQTTWINKGISGEFMGFIYVLPDGTDCTLAQMEARGLKEAMYAGANFAVIYTSDGKYLNGSAWNVGLSGGASAMAKGDDIAIAPSGGLGFGKAYSSNEMRPSLVIALYIQEDLIFEKIFKNPDRYEIER